MMGGRLVNKLFSAYESHADKQADVKSGYKINEDRHEISRSVNEYSTHLETHYSLSSSQEDENRWPDDARSYDRYQNSIEWSQRNPYTIGWSEGESNLPSREINTLPIVIPQGAASKANKFMSPFARVYAPQLASYGIGMQQFITFIDGLNEAYIASPVFQAMSMAGTAAKFSGDPIAHLVGMGVQTGSLVGSTLTSISRSRTFIAKANEDLFLPKGLVARFCSTADMTSILPCRDGMSLITRQGSIQADLTSPDATIDPRKMFLSRLDGYVAPLTWEVSAQEMPSNWIKKMGAWQAQRQEASATNNIVKGRSDKEIKLQEDIDNYKAQKMSDGRRRGGRGNRSGGDRDLRRMERDLKKEGKGKGWNKPPTQEEVLDTIKWVVIAPRHRGNSPSANSNNGDRCLSDRSLNENTTVNRNLYPPPYS